MKLNWNFLGGRGVQNKKPSMWGVWIFSGTAHSIISKYLGTVAKLLALCATHYKHFYMWIVCYICNLFLSIHEKVLVTALMLLQL